MANILLTTGRAPITLELARQLHAAGHTVFVTDTTRLHVTKFSRAIAKSFVLPSPRFETERYIQEITKIIESNRIDLLIPMWEEILYLSEHRTSLPSKCFLFADQFTLLHKLHNKWTFIQKLIELNIQVPKTQLILSQEDLNNLSLKGTIILKQCFSRASQNMYLFTDKEPVPKIAFDATNPWIAQEWLTGKKYCTYSILVNGSVLAHTAYPVNFAIDDSSCLNFVAIQHPKILEWVKNFGKLTGFTGQLAFDFIENERGLFVIECNPRGTSGIHLFKAMQRIDHAFFGNATKLIEPELGSTKQIITGMLLYGWKKKSFSSFFSQMKKAPDVVFEKKDMLPFFMQPLVFANILRWSITKRIPLPAAFTYDLNWNGKT